jgi:hypothetical protein
MHRIALPSAALLALLATAACGSGAPVEERTTDIAAADAEDVEEVDEEIDDSPSEVEAEIGSVYEFDDGLTIELSGIERAVSSEWAFPENAEYVRFTVQAQNGTGSAVDLEWFSIQCQYGDDGRTGEFVADTENGIGNGFTSTVMDGRNATADFGCEIPADETYLQIEVSVGDETPDSWMRPRVFFTGDID